VKESSHIGTEVASAILSALIPMGSQVNISVVSLHGWLIWLYVLHHFCGNISM